ncbi:N-acetyltransferase family protein [Variovorax sp. GB1P17]|uniref:GNAT family N-acetyltransferase n=1 Tax=Variovorax sp. GB1P17 TaxID=3443740 RepID=UPI003F471C6B
MQQDSAAITIRPWQLADFDAVKAILDDTFASTWQPQLTPEALQAYRDSGEPVGYIDQMGTAFFVAEIDGEVVGMVHWEHDFVHALHVPTAHQRKGIARALMAFAEDGMRAAGVEVARLETDTFNESSQGFYTAYGYREAGRYPDLEWHSGFTTILYVKPLGA